jgi:hypothetical protein
MDPIRIGKDAARNLWTHKYLWFFGLFVGAATGGAGAPRSTGHHAGGHDVPAWLVPVLIGTSVVALGALVMHVISEGALIEGVRRNRTGDAFRFGAGMRAGVAHFWAVLGVKLLFALTMATSAVVLALPVLGGVAGLYRVWIGAVLVAPLVLLAMPWLLSLYFGYLYALRFAVLDDRTAWAAIHEARLHLHGRVLDSLQLLLVAFTGQLGAGLAAVALLVPVAAVGALVYLLAGLTPAIVTAATLALPAVLAVVGAIGAFQSSVWTLGFLDGRSGASA